MVEAAAAVGRRGGVIDNERPEWVVVGEDSPQATREEAERLRQALARYRGKIGIGQGTTDRGTTVLLELRAIPVPGKAADSPQATEVAP